VPIICEHHSVSNENLIRDMDPFANKRMRRYLASLTNDRATLDLNKGTHTRVISDSAAIEIHEIRLKYRDVGAKFHARCYRHEAAPMQKSRMLSHSQHSFATPVTLAKDE
jgi:hypothetical protein